MVKRYTRRRIRGSRRGRQQRGRGTAGIVRRVASRVRQLERTKEETKINVWSDQGVAASIPMFGLTGWPLRNNNNFILLINGLQRGLTVQNRIGDQAVWTKIRARIVAYFGSQVVNDTWIKWRLVQEYRPEGTALTTATYFNNIYGVSQPSSRNLLPNSINRDQIVKYKTLKQGTLVVTGLNDQTVEERYIDIDWYSKGIKTNYVRNNLGTIADIDRNAIYLIVWTNTAVVTSGVTLYGEMQARYHG